jgi:hypothetical protein
MFKLADHIKFFLLIAIFGVNESEVLAQRQNLLVESTFESTTNYLAGWANNQHCCDYSVQQTAEQVKAGSKAMRIEVRSTDASTSGAIRSEITQDADPLNQDRWYGFSVYLKDWADDEAGEHVFQWHPNTDTGSASMSLWTTGGTFTYVTNNTGGTSNNEYTDLGPVLSNQWVDFVIRIRWATDTTGLLQVWMKGNLVINRINVKTGAGTSYFKLGINKFGWGNSPSTVTKRILYYDEVRIGNSNATYNDVAPFLPRRDYFQGL